MPVNPDTLTMHKRRMDYAALFGVEQYGLVGGGRLRTRPPTADEYKNLAAGCEELAKYGADKGITLAYHPHVGCTIETEDEIDILLNETKNTSCASMFRTSDWWAKTRLPIFANINHASVTCT